MTPRIFIITVFFSSSLLGQIKQCSCSTNSHLSGNIINCTTTTLSNGYKLYWQFNCNSIWLTLETIKNKRIVIDRIDTMFYDLTYRLGYNLVKEFKKSLLFTHSCPANGPCYYILIDKYSGQIIKKFGVLIGDPDDSYKFDFVIYLSASKDHLRVYFPDAGKSLQVSVNKGDFFYLTPEYQFDNIQVNNKVISLTYETSRSQSKSVKKIKSIDITKYSR